MILFQSDYLEGAHPEVLKALCETNDVQTPGYGEDDYCERARAMIRDLCHAPDSAVHFVTGGTQANRTIIAASLRPHQGVLSATTGHINVHETGAIENSGHKVLVLPEHDGKITVAQVREAVLTHRADGSFEHMVQPAMVYISNPTEIGTVYTGEELTEMYAVCRELGLYLFVDGARLACALAAEGVSYGLAGLAERCDVFTIGGTKLGALFGEAIVITNPALQKDFRYYIKQNGGMLAKGRLLGVQYLALLRDGLYERIGEKEVEQAMRLRRGLAEKGWSFLVESPTNQQFPILPDTILAELSKSFCYSFWQSMGDGMSAVRFCTSWATTEESIDALLAAIPEKK